MVEPGMQKCRTIGDHGAIGDLETAALVSRDGTIDYLCWPSLDSPTIFAELLDNVRGGAFSIRPELEDVRHLQVYVPDTNILLTRYMAEDGSGEIVDLMPCTMTEAGNDLGGQCLVRCVTVTRGTINFVVQCMPRFDYARRIPQVEAFAGGVRFHTPDLAIRLFSSVALASGSGEAGASFTLSAGESAWFVLGEDTLSCPEDAAIDRVIKTTTAAWRGWMSRSTYKGRWREHVARSALALKLLTSRRHGSIAAAATFSLPEAIGGERNWDYRATWIRDASFTIYAFMRLGFIEEAEQFNLWAADRVMAVDADHPIRIMYALDGSAAPDEQELTHLSGYAGSHPVRIGNAAHAQSQLDIFGELMDSVYLSNKYGRAISHQGWQHVCGITEYVAEHWQEADAGIWEMRSEPRHFLHSRVMCWVAMDRAIRLAQKRSLSAPFTRWAECRAAITEDIWANFRHPEHGYFVQERGGRALDAALLMMPLMRFVSSTDPVWLKTLDAIGEQLRDDGMVYRYRNDDDGLEGTEGAFTTCTFWYAECLARAGRLDDAQLMLEKGLAYANSLGLFAEETDVRGLPLGNFPQALTHLAFISAAHFIDSRLDPSYRPQWQP